MIEKLMEILCFVTSRHGMTHREYVDDTGREFYLMISCRCKKRVKLAGPFHDNDLLRGDYVGKKS